MGRVRLKGVDDLEYDLSPKFRVGAIHELPLLSSSAFSAPSVVKSFLFLLRPRRRTLFV